MQTRAAFILIFLLLFLAACAQVAPPRSNAALLDANAVLNARLRAPITPSALTADNQGLEKVLHYIAEKNNINMVIDWEVLRAAGIENTTPVSLDIHDVSLSTALSTVLSIPRSTDILEFKPIDGIVFVSTKGPLATKGAFTYVRKT